MLLPVGYLLWVWKEGPQSYPNCRLLQPSVARADELPDGELTFFNVRTDERLRVRYRDDAGNYDLTALDEVNHILRCHHTGEVAAIDVRVLEHVNLVQKTVDGAGEIHVISGYRSPEYNAQLVKRSRRAARHSQCPPEEHHSGKHGLAEY